MVYLIETYLPPSHTLSLYAQPPSPHHASLSNPSRHPILTSPSFTAQVKLHSILLRTSASPSAPQTLHVFLNRHDIDFSSADDATPTQTFELSQTSEIQELPVRRARFNAVRRLTLFFPDNFGDGDEDVTRISYLGFRGEWTALGRAPQNILYEAAANPGDHKVKGVGVRNQGDVNF